MDQEIEPAPGLFDALETGVDALFRAHVAVEELGDADAGGQRFDPFLEIVAHVGEGELRARVGAGLRDSPSDGLVVRDAHDEPAFACQKVV